jgi:hypothetical protein
MGRTRHFDVPRTIPSQEVGFHATTPGVSLVDLDPSPTIGGAPWSGVGLITYWSELRSNEYKKELI